MLNPHPNLPPSESFIPPLHLPPESGNDRHNVIPPQPDILIKTRLRRHSPDGICEYLKSNMSVHELEGGICGRRYFLGIELEGGGKRNRGDWDWDVVVLGDVRSNVEEDCVREMLEGSGRELLGYPREMQWMKGEIAAWHRPGILGGG